MSLGKILVVAMAVISLQGCVKNPNAAANANAAPVTVNTQPAYNPTINSNSYLYRAPTPAMVRGAEAIHVGR